MQRYPAPTACPVCGAQMRVTHLKCDRCQTELTGNFAPCRFCALPEKDLRFIETFLRCRGSIKDVERALGVSYPTVRNMLDSALRALGYEMGTEAGREEGDRRQVLELLNRGEIDAREAVARLKALREKGEESDERRKKEDSADALGRQD